MQLFHGSHNANSGIFEGQCWTEDRDVAECYARMGGGEGLVLSLTIDEYALVVVECDGYDRNENEAPADRASYRAALECDLAMYDDEDEQGSQHDCVRICSDRAVAAFAAAEMTVESVEY